MSATEPIRIVAAVIVDEAGRLLLVRKRGTQAFMQPGGKIAPGETLAQAGVKMGRWTPFAGGVMKWIPKPGGNGT